MNKDKRQKAFVEAALAFANDYGPLPAANAGDELAKGILAGNLLMQLRKRGIVLSELDGSVLITAEMLKEAFLASDSAKKDFEQGYIDSDDLLEVLLDGRFNFEDIVQRLNAMERVRGGGLLVETLPMDD